MTALHLTPNVITCLGTLLNGVAAWLAYSENWPAAAAVFLLGSLLDAMDGAVATVTGNISTFGAFLDSTLDRISEGLVITGLGLYFAAHDRTGALAACFVALACSYLVSYTRARAEALGVECKVGLASRLERVVVITAGLALAHWWTDALDVTMYVVAATTSLTVLQRILHVRKNLRLAA
jgi:CDP-diacylglycerol--glycerol-3-phosphate 3-phosphatidyltransferase